MCKSNIKNVAQQGKNNSLSVTEIIEIKGFLPIKSKEKFDAFNDELTSSTEFFNKMVRENLMIFFRFQN